MPTLLENQAKLNYLSIFKGHTELSHDYTVNIWFLVVYLDVIVAVLLFIHRENSSCTAYHQHVAK